MSLSRLSDILVADPRSLAAPNQTRDSGRTLALVVGGLAFGVVVGCALFGFVEFGSRQSFLPKSARVQAPKADGITRLMEYGPMGGSTRDQRPCSTPVKYIFRKILHNNFGGVGPDSGSKTMRLEVALDDPRQVPAGCTGRPGDCGPKYLLEIRSLSEYRGTVHNHNGLNGTMATLALDTGSSVDVEFVLTNVTTGEVVVPPIFPISFFDIDSDNDGSGQEFVIPHGRFFPILEDGALIDWEVSPGVKGDSVRYIAHPLSGVVDNPGDPYHLSLAQRQRVVVFEFTKPESVTVTMGSTFGTGIRLFALSMMSVLKPCADNADADSSLEDVGGIRGPSISWPLVLGILVGVLLLAAIGALIGLVVVEWFCNKWRYRYRVMDMSVPKAEKARRDYALESLDAAFLTKDSWRYRCALELAVDAGVPTSDIPTVFQLLKVQDSFNQLSLQTVSEIKVQLCFVLDYTGSMGGQIKDVMSTVKTITEQVQRMRIPHMPHTKVVLTMSAVAYNDFDEKSRSFGVPVVAAFGGRAIREPHSNSLTPASFNLGGRFTHSSEELQGFIDMRLGHGGNDPEELTGALIAASHLPWSADFRICIVITDAPCHGKDYHNTAEDNFTDAITGLSCSGRPEPALQSLGDQKVEVSVLHTGSGVSKMLDRFKAVLPRLKEGKVAPSETGAFIVNQLRDRLNLQPLVFDIRPFGLEERTAASGAPASGHTVVVKAASGGAQKQLATCREGLMWIGCPRKDWGGRPRVLVARAADAALDKSWEASSSSAELPDHYTESFAASVSMAVKRP